MMLKPLVPDKTKYKLNGKEVSAEEFRASARGIAFGEEVAGDRPACWPKTSESLGVMPEQVKDAMAFDRKIGFNTHYTKDGALVVPGKEFLKDYARAIGKHTTGAEFHARNGGYSDP